MKLVVEISRGLVSDGPGEYWGDCLCVCDEKGRFVWSNYYCFDIDYCGDGCRLPTCKEIQDFIAIVKKKFPDAIVEDGTGVL